MTTFDRIAFSALSLASFAIVIVGGVFHPHTLAGSVARFVFSLN